jgi:hypothetical protein
MDKGSPHYLYSHDHLPYLYRCHERGEVPTKATLKRMLESDPEAATDPLMASYLRGDAIGALTRKRGRKNLGPRRWSQTMRLSILVPLRAEEIRKERSANAKGVGCYDLSPIQQAAEDYARDWRLASGRSLLNRISAHKNSCPIVVNATVSLM